MRLESLRTGTGRNLKHCKVRRPLLATAAIAALASITAAAHAATSTWTGGGGNPNWGTAGNWDVLPLATDLLQFGGTTNLITSNNFAGNTAFSGISFLAGAGSFTLGGNAAIITGDINNNSGVAQTLGFATAPFTFNGLTYTQGGLVLDGSTTNINVSAGGSLALGQVTFGAAPQSTNVSTLNINNSVAASGLTVQTNSAGVNAINIAAGQTLTVNGGVFLGTPSTSDIDPDVNIPTNVTFAGGGNLVTGGGNFFVGLGSQNFDNGDRNVARVDMTALNNFTYSTGATGTGLFGVGWMTRPDGQLRLSATANTIVADVIGIGNSGITGTNSSPNNSGTTAILYLGAGTNVINADNINIGAVKGAGSLQWDPAVTTGTLTVAAQNGTGRANFTLGNQTSATGAGANSTVNFAGHSVNILADTITLGRLGGATGGTVGGTFVFDTGTIDVNTLSIAANVSGTAGNGVLGSFTMNGGTLTVNNALVLGNDTSAAVSGKTDATFTISAGTATINAPITRVVNGGVGTDASVLNVSGGTLDVTGKSIGSVAAPLTAINISGGTLANAARIHANAITIANTPTVSGAPVYVLSDAGTLTSPGLTLASGQGIAGGGANAATVSGDVTANTGARIDPGSTGVAGALTFNNNLTLNNGSSLRIDLADTTAAGSSDVVNVTGNLSLAGTVNVEIGAIGAGATVGNIYVLANYTGLLSGNETNLLVSDGSRKTFTPLATAGTPNQIQVSVGGGGPVAVTWLGDDSNNWEVGGAVTNFEAAGPVAEKFFNQDNVTFSDASSNLNAVNLVGQLVPATVAVDAARNYTFAGTGAITGGGTLTKSGAGTLTVTNANTFVGATTINAGVLALGDGGALGASPITNNATLRINRTDTSTLANVISGGGAVEHTGTGKTTFKNGNVYNGTTSIAAGTVVIEDETSLGDVNGGPVTIAPGATLDLSAGTAAQNIDFGSKQFFVGGTGVGGLGALVNRGVSQNAAFELVTLTADTLVNTDGTGGNGRFDFRRAAGDNVLDIDMAGFTLTKIGAGQFSLVHVDVGPGSFVANEGMFAIEQTTNIPDTGGTITYNNGTTAQWFGNSAAATQTRPMIFNGIINTGNASGAAAFIGANMTVNGTLNHIVLGGQNTTETTFGGNITGAGVLTKSGNTTLVLGGAANAYAGGTTISAGTVRTTGGGNVLGTGNVANNGALQVYGSAASALQNVTGTGTTTVGDGGTSVAATANHVRQASITIGSGSSLTINPNGGAAGVSRVTNLVVNGGAKLDLKDNKLVTADAVGTWTGAYDGVAGLIDSARGNAGNAQWDGPTGITTTDARAINTNDLVSIGVASASDARNIAATASTTFAGQTVLGSETLVMVTYGGDANLDGKINIDDYGQIDSNVSKSGSVFGWNKGDFNYDGQINIDDYGIIDGNIGRQTGSFPAAGGAGAGGSALDGVAAVPEPASLSLVVLGAAALLRRRRRDARGATT